MFVKFVDSEQCGQILRFFVNHSGVQWYLKRDLGTIIETVKKLQNAYHTAEFFKSNLCKRFLKLEDCNDASTYDLVNQVLSELTSLYVIRKDREFRELFEVDSHLSDENCVSQRTLQVK